MWSPGVDIARAEYQAHDIFFEGKDLDFGIDFSSWLTTRKFSEDNPDLVRAVTDRLIRAGKVKPLVISTACAPTGCRDCASSGCPLSAVA